MRKNRTYTKKETQNNVLEHSKAKLEFYQNYLWRYLTVLLNDQYTTKINIYDVFCGVGIYEDGGKGSPIIAIETIKNLSKKYLKKSITLTVNDIDIEKVQKVKSHINDNFKNVCEFTAYNLNAIEMIETVIANIKKSKKDEKNLVFIDPYGYKEIYKQNILDIMEAGKSEIILFLPISNMYRFSRDAINNEENKSYMHLRRFIEEFFDESHPIHEGKFEHQLEYIEFIKTALCFNDIYFSASYSIQRDTKNYYSLFFITSHIYGLEKVLETKWKLDALCGEGFEQNKQAALFDEENKENKKNECFKKLKISLFLFLNEYKTNYEIYEFVIKEGFSPSHANKALEDMRESLSFESDYKPRKNAFLVGYKYYKEKDKRYRVKII